MAVSCRVALVSDDLIFRSQLAQALGHSGAELRSSGRLVAPGLAAEVDVVFVDLNAEVGHRLGLVATLREAHPDLEIVSFCHHGEKQTREAAMRAGATSCVTNGALQAVALRLTGVRVPSGERVD